MKNNEKTAQSITSLIVECYTRTGGIPDDIAFIRPRDGDWSNALSYQVVKNDRSWCTVYRRAIDDDDINEIISCVRRFKQSGTV
jgi:hypothetical protein